MHALRKCGHALPLPRSTHFFVFFFFFPSPAVQLHAACYKTIIYYVKLQNYYQIVNNILYYMTIKLISQQREREQVGHTQELITKIIMHVKHSTYEKTPQLGLGTQDLTGYATLFSLSKKLLRLFSKASKNLVLFFPRRNSRTLVLNFVPERYGGSRREIQP